MRDLAADIKQTAVDIDTVNNDVNNLRTKHGAFFNSEEAAFHIGRAYRTLERNLDDKYVSAAIKREKMLHLAAVCLRGALTIPASDE